jgi:Protein of unknown function (DUF3604)
MQEKSHESSLAAVAVAMALVCVLPWVLPWALWAIVRAIPVASGADGTPPALDRANPEREAWFGDLHLHTNYSFDAYLEFGAQVDPDGAYRFARGESGKFLGEQVKRSSPPLDFMAVTDHAEFLGVLNTIEDPASALARSEIGKGFKAWDPQAVTQLRKSSDSIEGVPSEDVKKAMQSAWQREMDAANSNYRPGTFTTFIAYEWTSAPGAQNLHRNVIFRGDRAPDPFTAIDSKRPEDLWAWLESIRKQGYEALAIPHNPNGSNGLMFDWVDSSGKPIDEKYAEQRAANEPLLEIVQNKGQSETHPALSANDEFASFEVFDFAQRFRKDHSSKVDGSYVRQGLGRGLEIAQHTGGVNPFKYGFVGASDYHDGLSDSSESAYGGLQVAVDAHAVPPLDSWMDRTVGRVPGEREGLTGELYQSGSAGLTGVWAEQNTRESIFAALRRKETFATSGTRLKLRFFGSWSFKETLLGSKNWVRKAYHLGVPMGADLPTGSPGKAVPGFAVWAMKDPNGANLDRLQIVKVWLEGGKYVEKVYDVALSNGRRVDLHTGKAPAVGNTVNLHDATYTNTIGATELTALWRDPRFDPKEPAVYYLRALEIPTPRWSTIVAVKRGEPLPDGIPATIQERGWSSPIWYSPPPHESHR